MQPPAAISEQIQQIQKGNPANQNPQPPANPNPQPPANPGGGGDGGGGGSGGGGGGGGGPPGGAPGGGGGPPGGAPPATQAQPAGGQGTPRSHHLEGKLQTFNGDRSKSKDFEKNFGLYRLLNVMHPLISVPLQRVALALSYIQGPKVDKWAQLYAEYLAGQVYRVAGQPAVDVPTDEGLWNEFVIAFRRQFRDTAEVQRAWAVLQTLEMKPREIDTYIAKFKNLLHLAERA